MFVLLQVNLCHHQNICHIIVMNFEKKNVSSMKSAQNNYVDGTSRPRDLPFVMRSCVSKKTTVSDMPASNTELCNNIKVVLYLNRVRR